MHTIRYIESKHTRSLKDLVTSVSASTSFVSIADTGSGSGDEEASFDVSVCFDLGAEGASPLVFLRFTEDILIQLYRKLFAIESTIIRLLLNEGMCKRNR